MAVLITVEEARGRIRNKVIELARELGNDAHQLSDNDIIPEVSILDSASLLMLILWFEEEFQICTETEELTIDNFGSINLMVDYLQRNVDQPSTSV